MGRRDSSEFRVAGFWHGVWVELALMADIPETHVETHDPELRACRWACRAKKPTRWVILCLGRDVLGVSQEVLSNAGLCYQVTQVANHEFGSHQLLMIDRQMQECRLPCCCWPVRMLTAVRTTMMMLMV